MSKIDIVSLLVCGVFIVGLGIKGVLKRRGEKQPEAPTMQPEALDIQIFENKRWTVFHKDVHGVAIGIVQTSNRRRGGYLTQSFLPDSTDKYFNSLEEAREWVTEKWGSHIQRIKERSVEMGMKTLAENCECDAKAGEE